MPKVRSIGTLTSPDGTESEVDVEYDPTDPGSAKVTPKKDERIPLPEEIIRRDGEAGIDLIRRRREARGGHTSGFCLDAIRLEPFAGKVALARDPDEWHELCRGATTNGAGRTSLCICPCHDEYPICHECKKPYSADDVEYDRERRRCVNRGECADRIAEAHRIYAESNESIQQIRAIKAEIAARGGADGPEGGGGSAKATKTPRKAAKGTPQRCHCGCGGMTKGGRFCMGHDMKLKGRLFEAARKPYVDVDQAAVDEIVARGWSETDIHQGLLATARGKDEMDVIRRAVFGRYNGVEGEIA